MLSFFYISPTVKKLPSNYRLSQLEQVIRKEDNEERTDYVDEEGRITVAADVGYATKVITKTENSELEIYFDDKGERVRRYSGYYGVLREYDENGCNTRTTYLDLEGNPVIVAQGYAIEEKVYNSGRQNVSVKYHDPEGNPIYTSSYGYGKNNEFNDDGTIRRITYVDKSGNPMMTEKGYSSVIRNYYYTEGPEYRKVESEFYYDETGHQISLSLGEYGVHKEYDEHGKEKLLTYLDADGNPAPTIKGYTTVLRTYQPNGAVRTEQYYDTNGNPFRLDEGQYGFKRENGETVYLDKNGNPKFNLRNLLYNQSWMVIIIALLIVIVSVVFDRKLDILLLFVYFFAIVYLTLMFREDGDGQVKLELFWSYKEIFTNSGTRAEILKNIWLFIPLGAILYKIYPRKLILTVPIILSIIIEGVQYIMGIGLCELDDVISNGIGGAIGYWMVYQAGKAKQQVNLSNKI